MLNRIKKFFGVNQELQAFTSDEYREAINLTSNNSDKKIGTNKEVINLYKHKQEFGSSLIRSIVDYRKSWIVGNETTVSGKNPETQRFIEDFLNYNKFDIQIQKYALYSELEGKLLTALNIKKDKDGTKIIPQVMPEYLFSYDLTENEYNEVQKMTYTVDSAQYELSSKRFVYSKFFLLDETDQKDVPSLYAYIVKDCIDIDYTRSIWDKIIEKYKNPSYLFETANWQDASKLASLMKSSFPSGWEFGKGLSAPAKANMLPFPMDKIETLKDSMFNRMQKISTLTGVPIYLLGYADIVNYATSEDMLESIKSKTMVERVLMGYHIKEVVSKSIDLYNETTGSNIPNEVEVSIPPSSVKEVENLIDKFLNLYNSKVISKQTLQEILPMIDPEKEVSRLMNESNQDASIISDNIQRGLQNINNRGTNNNV